MTAFTTTTVAPKEHSMNATHKPARTLKELADLFFRAHALLEEARDALDDLDSLLHEPRGRVAMRERLGGSPDAAEDALGWIQDDVSGLYWQTARAAGALNMHLPSRGAVRRPRARMAAG